MSRQEKRMLFLRNTLNWRGVYDLHITNKVGTLPCSTTLLETGAVVCFAQIIQEGISNRTITHRIIYIII